MNGLSCQRPFDRSLFIRRARIGLETRRPTKGARVSDGNLRDFKTPNLPRGEEEPHETDKLCYFGCFISSGFRISNEGSSRGPGARLMFTRLRNVWSRCGIQLSTKGGVYVSTVRSVLLEDPETWPFRTKDMRRFPMLAYRCLRNTIIDNGDFGYTTLSCRAESFEDAMNLSTLRWLG